MRDYLAEIWLKLRNRPLFFLGLLAGIATVCIIAILSINNIEINKRVTKVEAQTPCLNLTSRQCAHKLLNSLPKKERRTIRRNYENDVERAAKKRAAKKILRLRHLFGPSASNGASGGSPERSPGSSPPGSQRSGSSPVTPNNGSSSDSSGSSGSTGNGSPAQPQPTNPTSPPSNPSPGSGSSGGSTGSGGSGSTGTTTPNPIIRVPSINLPPVHTPPIVIPCVELLGVVNCK